MLATASVSNPDSVSSARKPVASPDRAASSTTPTASVFAPAPQPATTSVTANRAQIRPGVRTFRLPRSAGLGIAAFRLLPLASATAVGKDCCVCRWLAYSGSPIRLEELLVKRDRSLIDQSLHSRQGATTTNGDGFGVGWYEEGEPPRVYRSVHPAWNDRNLRELAAGISSPLFFAHIRASTGGAIQETNVHPFRHGRWLWMHNGLIREFPRVQRELQMQVAD